MHNKTRECMKKLNIILISLMAIIATPDLQASGSQAPFERIKSFFFPTHATRGIFSTFDTTKESLESLWRIPPHVKPKLVDLDPQLSIPSSHVSVARAMYSGKAEVCARYTLNSEQDFVMLATLLNVSRGDLYPKKNAMGDFGDSQTKCEIVYRGQSSEVHCHWIGTFDQYFSYVHSVRKKKKKYLRDNEKL